MFTEKDIEEFYELATKYDGIHQNVFKEIGNTYGKEVRFITVSEATTRKTKYERSLAFEERNKFLKIRFSKAFAVAMDVAINSPQLFSEMKKSLKTLNQIEKEIFKVAAKPEGGNCDLAAMVKSGVIDGPHAKEIVEMFTKGDMQSDKLSIEALQKVMEINITKDEESIKENKASVLSVVFGKFQQDKKGIIRLESHDMARVRKDDAIFKLKKPDEEVE